MVRHPDDEALAALVLGDGSTEDAAHAATCERCSAEVTALEAALAQVSSAGPIALTPPPERVWTAIAAQIAGDEPSSAGGGAGVDQLAERRSRRTPRWAFVAAAAAAGALVGAFGVSMLDRGTALQGTVVASAPLASLADESPAGSAEVVRRDDGTEVLVVDTETASVTDAYLEVWLIDTAVEGMISLGPLTSDHEEFVIPAGFDVAAHPIVDISVEPLDGVPTHSGDSVTRGILGE